MHISKKINNITCASCVNTIQKTIVKHGGSNVLVSQITGITSYEVAASHVQEIIEKKLASLGYSFNDEAKNATKCDHVNTTKIDIALWISLILTIILLIPHVFSDHSNYGILKILHLPLVQLAICLPVYAIGVWKIGINGIKSLLRLSPNMNALIIIGSTMALLYSVLSFLLGNNMYFFEASASIIAFVLLGNFLEKKALFISRREIRKLLRQQEVNAIMITFDENYQEVYLTVPSATLKEGDLLLIKTGERVPTDCKILSGEAWVDEAIVTGESMPIAKTQKSTLIGGSLLVDGIVKVQVTKNTSESTLQKIISLIEQAQQQKPPIQKLADKISAVFVPLVFVLSLVTFFMNYYYLDSIFSESMMRSIAVLVIACACALGLATPAAISIGMGIAARKGIFFKKTEEMEKFKFIKTIIFDKTGTLTTGKFRIHHFQSTIDEDQFKSIVVEMEKYSTHPIAKSILAQWDNTSSPPTKTIIFKEVKEQKSLGMMAVTEDNHVFQLGSFKIVNQDIEDKKRHSLYLTKNQELIGWIDIKDTIKPDAKELIQALEKHGIHSIMLSGDQKAICEDVAQTLGIKTVYAEKRPEEKLEFIKALNAQQPVAMVGDGINDAPALSEASIGIVVNDASQLSIQTASVVITNVSLKSVLTALRIGKDTYQAIVRNLAWAFGYNLLAIPIASFGYITPIVAAQVMGLSDVMLVLLSLLLYTKKYS